MNNVRSNVLYNVESNAMNNIAVHNAMDNIAVHNAMDNIAVHNAMNNIAVHNAMNNVGSTAMNNVAEMLRTMLGVML